MSSVREPAFLATVYHDEPEDAATDSKAEWFPSLKAAAGWARERMAEPYWNGFPATAHYGFVVKERGHVPPRWEDDDREAPWLVYADRMERDG